MDPHLHPEAPPALMVGAVVTGPLAAGLIAFGILVLAFAGLVTTHFALAYRLARLGPAWRGWLALLVPPLAPAWGLSAGLRVLPAVWLLMAVVYLASLVLASWTDPQDPQPSGSDRPSGAAPEELFLRDPAHDPRHR